MDLFKRKMNDEATAIDWNVPKICKRRRGDTARLHRLARRRLKGELKEEIKNEITGITRGAK